MSNLSHDDNYWMDENLELLDLDYNANHTNQTLTTRTGMCQINKNESQRLLVMQYNGAGLMNLRRI